jgi:hypothetical protein
VPATIAPTVTNNDSQAAASASVALDLPVTTQPVHLAEPTIWDTGPPNDIVVSFHRLVI